MNTTNQYDIFKTHSLTSSNGISQGTSKQPLSRLTFSERDLYPSSVSPSAITTSTTLLPRRDSSIIKHHRQRYPMVENNQEKQYQPLLNSSTLDDLFRALTLECEQYLAATSSYQNKTYGQIITQPSTTTNAESNDEDYENLHTKKLQPIINNSSPLKTSIEVISPIKRHVVSVTITSKVCPVKTSCITKPSIQIPPPTICQSSEDDSINKSSSSTNRKRRRHRPRKQYQSTTTIRSSSSSTERKEIVNEKKPTIVSKRSCSTDPRYQHKHNSFENHFISSSQKQSTKRPRRRDVSLQHSLPYSGRYQENSFSPLSVLLTSTKITSDFLNNPPQRQQRRSRLENTVQQKSSTLLDRMHQQFYRPTTRSNNNNNNTNKNIPTHRIPSYPVY